MTRLYVLNGPEMGRSFELQGEATYVGRSRENDIHIEDKTVSRRHLKIVRRGGEVFVVDLESQNGTFLDGNYIAPGLELKAKEGVPIAIGMTLICLGKGCVEQMIPLIDSIGLTRETGDQSGIFRVHKGKTNQKKLELVFKVSEALEEELHITEILGKVLTYITDFLKKIDRTSIILLDPGNEKILEVVFKSTHPDADTTTMYCRDLVKRVIEGRKPVIFSNVQTEEDDDELLETLKILKIESVMSVPLITDSIMMGVLYVDSLERPYGFAKEDLALFVDLSQRIAIAIENSKFAFDMTTIADTHRTGK